MSKITNRTPARAFALLAAAVALAACNPPGAGTQSPLASAEPSVAPIESPISSEAAPSSAAATTGDRAYLEQQLSPAIQGLLDATQTWSEALVARVSTNGAPSPSDSAAYQKSVTDLRTAITKARDAVNAQAPACASDAQAKAKAFVDFVDQNATPLLSKSSPTSADVATVTALLPQAGKLASDTLSATVTACS